MTNDIISLKEAKELYKEEEEKRKQQKIATVKDSEAMKKIMEKIQKAVVSGNTYCRVHYINTDSYKANARSNVYQELGSIACFLEYLGYNVESVNDGLKVSGWTDEE